MHSLQRQSHLCLPRLVPRTFRHLSQRERPALPVQNWELDELRRWLSHARSHRARSLRQFTQMAATRGWRSSVLRHRLSVLLASPTLYWLSFYEASRADSSVFWRNRFIREELVSLGDKDARLDPAEPCHEPFDLTLIAKSSGFRPIYDEGPRMRGRRRQIANLMTAMLRPGYFVCQAMHSGRPRKAMLNEIRARCAEPDGRYFAVTDVRNFFGSISHCYLFEWLPFPEAVITNSVIHPFEKGETPRPSEQRSETDMTVGRASYLDISGHGTRRGVPQGASSSPIIAYALLEAAIRPLKLAGSIFQWADDIVIFGRSLRDVEDRMLQLSQVLREHRAGPLSLGKSQVGETRGGFDFNGHRFARSRDEVRTALTIEARDRFFDRLTECIDRDARNQDTTFRRAILFLEGWREQTICDELPDLYSCALTAIDQAADKLPDSRFGSLAPTPRPRPNLAFAATHPPDIDFVATHLGPLIAEYVDK
jgi:hypothetical protein